MCAKVDKVDYGSEHLGTNAVALHMMTNPLCPGFQHYPCGDHWHTGHSVEHGRQLCIGRHADYRHGVRHERATLQQ